MNTIKKKNYLVEEKKKYPALGCLELGLIGIGHSFLDYWKI